MRLCNFDVKRIRYHPREYFKAVIVTATDPFERSPLLITRLHGLLSQDNRPAIPEHMLREQISIQLFRRQAALLNLFKEVELIL